LSSSRLHFEISTHFLSSSYQFCLLRHCVFLPLFVMHYNSTCIAHCQHFYWWWMDVGRSCPRTCDD
jgi:hypothetical protein